MSRNVWFICLMAFALSLAACSSASAYAGVVQLNDGRSFNYTLELPASWDGKYEVQHTGSSAAYEYTAAPKTPIFTLTALTEAEWAQIQNDPGSTHIITQDGAVFLYTIALENLYSGSQAEEFQQMAGDVQGIVGTLEVTAVK